MVISKNRFSFKLGLAALAMGMIVGCNKDAPTTDKPAGDSSAPKTTTTAQNDIVPGGIPFGLVASENGELKPWGEDSVKGARMAIEEFNAAGGANGKKVSLYIEDSASKPEQGKSAAEKLASDDKVIVLLGEVASGITQQMGAVATEKGLPLIAIGATRTDLTAGKPNMFRVCYTDAFQGPVMAKFAYDQLKLRNVALMTDKKQPYSTGLSASFSAFFTKLGGHIVDEESYEGGAASFQGQLKNAKAKNPDGLFMSGYFNDTGPIARQAKDEGLQVKMLGGDGWDSSQILTSGGDAIIGSFFCNHYNNKDPRPVIQDFLKKWAAKYNGEVPATTMGALAYDAAKLACDALKRSATPDATGLQAAIENTVNFDGVSGSITLKGMHGNPPKRALVVELVKDPSIPNGQKFAKAYDAGPDGLPK